MWLIVWSGERRLSMVVFCGRIRDLFWSRPQTRKVSMAFSSSASSRKCLNLLAAHSTQAAVADGGLMLASLGGAEMSKGPYQYHGGLLLLLPAGLCRPVGPAGGFLQQAHVQAHPCKSCTWPVSLLLSSCQTDSASPSKHHDVRCQQIDQRQQLVLSCGITS